MASKNGLTGNALLDTPVAAIAITLFTDLLKTDNVATERLPDVVKSIVDCAEVIVGELIDRGHLPRELPQEPPSESDSLLILRSITLGIASWLPLKPGDPRGEFWFGGQKIFTKLEGGVPKLAETTMAGLRDAVAEKMRSL